jgi:hypothetical protein
MESGSTIYGGTMRRRLTLFAAALAIVVPGGARAYLISAHSLGAGGFQDSNTLAFVEKGALIGDSAGNTIDGHASTAGDTGSLNGYMKVHIVDYFAAQSTSVTNFLLEKQWKSEIIETIEDFQRDPGATELVIRVRVSGEDQNDLAIAPSPGFDNGYAHSHALAQLRYYNANSHTSGLAEILAVGRADRNVPLEWTEVFGGDTAPPGYGSASGGDASAVAELHIPASEVDGDDTLLVAARLYGEVRGGHWNGAFAASELHGGMSFEIIGGSGAPQNPIFFSAPEPDAAFVGDVAMASLLALATRRRA